MDSKTNSQQPESHCTSYQVKILDSHINYLKSGNGRPVVFIHGIPTSSFLWRHIIADMQKQCECYALDLIGMGSSGKPKIEYSIADHVKYFSAWMDEMHFSESPILVMHGWGSTIGFHYASLHPDAVAGLVFYEAHIRAAKKWDMLSLPIQQWAASFMSNIQRTKQEVIENNIIVDKLFPSGSLHHFSETEMQKYRAPFARPKDREPLWRYLQELPLGEDFPGISPLIDNYSNWLQQTSIPKLMCYGVPGFITTIETVRWAKDNLSQLTTYELEDVLHFAQESSPKRLSECICNWMSQEYAAVDAIW